MLAVDSTVDLQSRSSSETSQESVTQRRNVTRKTFPVFPHPPPLPLPKRALSVPERCRFFWLFLNWHSRACGHCQAHKHAQAMCDTRTILLLPILFYVVSSFLTLPRECLQVSSASLREETLVLTLTFTLSQPVGILLPGATTNVNVNDSRLVVPLSSGRPCHPFSSIPRVSLTPDPGRFSLMSHIPY